MGGKETDVDATLESMLLREDDDGASILDVLPQDDDGAWGEPLPFVSRSRMTREEWRKYEEEKAKTGKRICFAQK